MLNPGPPGSLTFFSQRCTTVYSLSGPGVFVPAAMEDNMMKKKIFISHASQDNKFVDNLRESLEIQGLDTWVDFSRLIGGDELEAEIKQAIEQAQAFIVVLSPNAINSSWVLKEVDYAREVKKKQKQPEDYRVIPLLLPGTGPGALKLYFKEEPKGIDIQIGPGGISEAMPQILAALGERQADDIQPMLSRPGEPLEELLLVLSDPGMVKKQDARRARARAKLTYFPGQKGKPEMESRVFFFTAPLGPIENEELTWYLERYFQWPGGVFKQRAQKVEEQLPEWGKALYDAVMNDDSSRRVLAAWESAAVKSARRFTVFVDAQLVKDSKKKEPAGPNEAAALLLGLPWELLHDDGGYLFQGARPVQVRRRLPNRRSLQSMVSEPPIRILLVSPRPEDERTGFIDHRVSALPLVIFFNREDTRRNAKK